MRTFPAAVPLVDAGRAFGLGRTKTHELARAGEFPVPLIKIGSSYRARRSDILDALGIVDAEPAATAS
ncbi:hypothetical protein F7O44_08115 [Phytoactinopolyspora sp. XMNu-373]|uniref:DNA-binding protein n=1 Tax=Phytoactinopolyspora mesophila TaxID=2650750 RepID=A0A7K3M182_9ACTN|nr:hypothetical protein [Phytoactinopolyspora mesophila]